MPSLVNDGPHFFPNVLMDPVFQRDGVLFGHDHGQSPAAQTRKGDNKEGDIQWAVVDPRRHIMYIWDKDVHRQDDFPLAAKSLGASVVTNASFNEYKGGSKTWGTIKVGLSLIGYSFSHAYIGSPYAASKHIKDSEIREIERKYWTGSKAQGHIFGSHEGISETKIDRPALHYFGRRTGRLFSDYEIAQGEAPQIEEVIGGLFRNVANYIDAEASAQTIGHGVWGLAPFGIDADLGDAGLGPAVETYEANDTITEPNKPHCIGLVIAVFSWEDVKQIATLLIAARVKDAVRVDGNDSILFGHHQTLLYGDDMGDAKRFYNRWGY